MISQHSHPLSACMYVYVCICMYVRVCTRIHVCTYVYIHVCVYTLYIIPRHRIWRWCRNGHILYLHACMYMYIHVYTYVCTCIYKYVCTHYTRMYVRVIYTHMCIQIIEHSMPKPDGGFATFTSCIWVTYLCIYVYVCMNEWICLLHLFWSLFWVNLFMYVCMYVWVHMHAYKPGRIWQIETSAHKYQVCRNISTHRICLWARMRVYVCIYVYIYMHMYAYKNIRM
jgi:hypothetical protein